MLKVNKKQKGKVIQPPGMRDASRVLLAEVCWQYPGGPGFQGDPYPSQKSPAHSG